MIRIKDCWVSTRDIKGVWFEVKGYTSYLNITYMFNDNDLHIEVDDFDEYNRLSELIANHVNRSLGTIL